jgi:hypothetical protein
MRNVVTPSGLSFEVIRLSEAGSDRDSLRTSPLMATMPLTAPRGSIHGLTISPDDA